MYTSFTVHAPNIDPVKKIVIKTVLNSCLFFLSCSIYITAAGGTSSAGEDGVCVPSTDGTAVQGRRSFQSSDFAGRVASNGNDGNTGQNDEKQCTHTQNEAQVSINFTNLKT